jgi:hypothetical protein
VKALLATIALGVMFRILCASFFLLLLLLLFFFFFFFFFDNIYVVLQFKFARRITAKIFPPGSGPKKANLRKGGAEVVTIAKLEVFSFSPFYPVLEQTTHQIA